MPGPVLAAPGGAPSFYDALRNLAQRLQLLGPGAIETDPQAIPPGGIRGALGSAAEWLGEQAPDFLAGAAWGDPMSPGTTANTLGQLAMVGLPLGMAAGAAAKKGIRAFHGSPHVFDKFSMEKIGTGEGGQVYGHGLYFAEKEQVAKSYKDALAPSFVFDTLDDLLRQHAGISYPPETVAQLLRVSRLPEMAADPQMVEDFRRLLPNYNPGAAVTGEDLARYRRLNDAVERQNPGKMYEVNIAADPEDLLDWDAPLSQQSPQVREKLQALRESPRPIVFPEKTSEGVGYDPRGANIYRAVATREAKTPARTSWGEAIDEPAASARLGRAGIPGLRYLDQGSRAAGEGTHNYVIWDDTLIDIVKAYLALLAAGGGAAATTTQGQPAPEGY